MVEFSALDRDFVAFGGKAVSYHTADMEITFIQHA